MFILISPRGSFGKTLGAQKLCRDIKIKEDLNSIWIQNLSDQIKRAKTKFLTKPKEFFSNEFWNVGIDNTGIYSYSVKRKENEKTKEVTEHIIDKNYYCWTHSLSGAENAKGARAAIGLSIYEEINVGLNTLRGDQTELYNNLVATYSDPVNFENDTYRKSILLCNFKTLNSKFLVDLGIYKIEKEVTKFKYGSFEIVVLCPQLSENERKILEKEHKQDWKYQLAKQTGQADHIFFNENLYDNLNNIKEYSEESLNKLFHLNYVLSFKQGFILMYFSDKGFWHLKYTALYTGNAEVLTATKWKKENSTSLNTYTRNQILTIFEKDWMSFQNVYSREQFLIII